MDSITGLILAVVVFQAVVLSGEKTKACMPNGSIRLAADRENSTCGFVYGVVEVCEDMQWKRICDDQWTVEDATVACRGLDHLSAGAVNITATQMASMTADLSSLVPQCSGSEQTFVNCSATALPEALQTNCMTVARVQCFVNESSAALCGGLPTISPTSTVTVPPDTTVESTTTRPGSTTPAAATTGDSTTGTIANTTGTTPPSDVSSNNTDPSTTQNLLQPFHYGIIGAGITLIIVIAVITTCLVMLGVRRRRRCSRINLKQNPAYSDLKLPERNNTIPPTVYSTQEAEYEEIDVPDGRYNFKQNLAYMATRDAQNRRSETNEVVYEDV